MQLVEAFDEDVLVDVTDAGAPRQLTHRQRLGAAVQHLCVPRRVAVQKLQQQRAPATTREFRWPFTVQLAAIWFRTTKAKAVEAQSVSGN